MADAALIPVIALFVLWFGFILAVNGPIASPKYRRHLNRCSISSPPRECAM